MRENLHEEINRTTPAKNRPEKPDAILLEKADSENRSLTMTKANSLMNCAQKADSSTQKFPPRVCG